MSQIQEAGTGRRRWGGGGLSCQPATHLPQESDEVPPGIEDDAVVLPFLRHQLGHGGRRMLWRGLIDELVSPEILLLAGSYIISPAISFPDHIPRLHSQATFPGCIPRSHSQVAFPGHIPRLHHFHVCDIKGWKGGNDCGCSYQ